MLRTILHLGTNHSLCTCLTGLTYLAKCKIRVIQKMCKSCVRTLGRILCLTQLDDPVTWPR